MQRVDLKTNPEVKAVILAAFPSYKKHQALLVTTDSVEIQGTYWDGGTRSTYRAVDLVSKISKGAPQYNPPQFGGPRTPVAELPNGVVIVEGGIFCGKTATAVVYVRADNQTKLLPDKQN